MKTSRIANFKAGVAPLVLGIALLSTPTLAQDAPADEDAAAEEGGGTILVTGSRIRRPNLESTIPIASISGEQFFESGDTNVGELLNDLPQLRSTFAQSNPGLGIGIAGLNLLDLRGLGTQRTLVLVNGRRHVPADINNNGVSPDVNTIPNDLIERVDIVTGGNSAVYGSDAIAGVVNFVLRRDFNGLQIRGSAGIDQKGFGANQYISALYGQNFADGRGNVTLHGEYARQERVFASQIPWFRQNNALVVTDIDPAGLPNGSDGVPDRTFLRDIRSTTIHRFGLVPVGQLTNPLCGVGISNGVTPGTAFNCNFIFNPDGSLVAQTGARVGTGINGTFIGGNGQTGREDRLLSVVPFTERYNFNLLTHYEIDDAVELFFEAKWNRVKARGSNFGPSFSQGTLGQFDVRERPRLDNPFLSAAARATLTSAILTSNCNTSFTQTCAATNQLTAAQRATVTDGSYRFVLGRVFADSGIRDEAFQRDTYRFVGGVRGEFNDDWNYELSLNYGKFEEDTVTFGFVDRQRFLLSYDAGRNPVTGQIQCRAQFDPTAAIVFPTSVAGNAAKLAADIAACIPYNPFGAADNTAAANYFVYNSANKASLDQAIISGFVSGDLSQIFELPAGPVSFAVGGEYRREKARFTQDAFAQSGATNNVSLPSFAPRAFEVSEAYLELRAPLLRGVPLFHELTLSGAGRLAKYQGGTGTVFAYNGGVDWSPVRGLRFRGNYSHSIRSPNFSETSTPLIANFAPNFQDPCRSANIGSGTQFRAANCAADLGALLNTPSFANQNAYSLQVVSGSNPNLRAETSNSLTLGAVLQPAAVPGLTFSADYYDIDVNGVITAVTAQNIVNGCYDAPTLNNAFCAVFTRFRGPGIGTSGEVPGQLLANSLIQAPLNFAKRVRRGVDFQVSYRTRFSESVSFSSNLIYTHNLKISNFANPTIPNFENRLLDELGDPADEFRWDVDLTVNKFTLGYRMRYIGPQFVNLYEDFNSLQGRPAQDADYADIQQFPAVFYHDLRFEWDIDNAGVGSDFNFYVGVNNVLNTHPPLGSTATGPGSAIFDYRGRNFFTGFRAKF